jgi:formylglycine-generating enzyme required for sulfatase activity
LLDATMTNSIGLALKLLPASSFLMGALPDEEHYSSDEGPQHRVQVKRPFYLGVYPVTQREFEVVMGYNPSAFRRGRGGGPDHPVTGISWEEAVDFCAKLSRLPVERRARRVYELPSEAQWEYACRAGTVTPFACGQALASRQANFNGFFPAGTAPKGPFLQRTTRVGSYPPNAWGFYDMHGNVWEWCNGYYYDDEHYRTAPRREEDDMPGGKPADPRVVRGGCWHSKGWRCRSADRYRCTPATGMEGMGLRVVWQPR